MKVLKHGNKWQLKDRKHCCEDCGCVFEFNQLDCWTEAVILKDGVAEVKEANDLLFAMLQVIPTKTAIYWHVKCPECRRKVRVEEVENE